MGEVLVAVKNNKLFQTLADACRDRGYATERALTLEEAEGRLQEGLFSALIVNLDDIQTSSEKKIAARIRSLPQDLKLMGLGSGASLKTVTGYFRAGLKDFLSLPPDPLELAQALTNLLGSLAGPAAGAATKPLIPPAAIGGEAAGTAASPSPAPQASPASSAATPADRGPGAGGAPNAQAAPEPVVVFPSRAIVGQSPALMKLFRIIAKVAATDSTVMVHGETGTGKELIARAIHLSSPRRDKPMIPVNCGAIPEELLETELFGHEKGAFTNAVKERAGRFELAQGGTVFLDEIGDMSPKLQVKLLRVLQEHEFEKVGGERTIRADIRVITATHVDLAKAVRDGRFREDLYYRLNVIPVSVPPLRDRAADIPLLIEYFLKRLRETRASTVRGVDPSALAQLCAYRWPGNIRELENLMERMVILADGDILTVDDLPNWIRTVPEPPDEGRDMILKGFLEPDEGLYDDSGPRSGEAIGQGPRGGLPDASPAVPKGGGEAPAATPEGPDGLAVNQFPDGRDDLSAPAFTGNFSGKSEDGPLTDTAATDGAFTGAAATEGDRTEGEFSGTDLAIDQFGEIPADSIPPELTALISPLMAFPPDGVSLNSLMKDYEGRLIEAALQASGGFKNNAARLLGINRTTLQEKLRKK
ncbi:MAG: sigma 54-interacting transcriptional regulator [Deltaproteobacteria bacterium]|jgi:DNA-binding NtrC family response regulator|nr:sigma 54-interacting transcriptional regulator [Deltaproteobacteria bacterium]